MIHEKCPVCGLIFTTKNQDPSVPVLSLRDPAHEVCSTACELIRIRRLKPSRAPRKLREMRLDEREDLLYAKDTERLSQATPQSPDKK
jgi:hypothetical protein